MRNRASFTLIRLAGPLLGLLLAGTALAAPKDGSGGKDNADCYSQALLQFNLAFVQCTNYPTGSAPFEFCQNQAIAAYSQAILGCSASSAAIVKHSGPGLMQSRRTVGFGAVSGRGAKAAGALRFAAPRPILGARRR